MFKLYFCSVVILVGALAYTKTFEENYIRKINNSINVLNKELQSFQKEYSYLKNSTTINKEDIVDKIHEIRLILKKVDPWLRYFEPIEYKKINGPLLVEWEVEAFEKFEKPYKREGSGLYLMEELVQEEKVNFNAFLNFCSEAQNSLKLYLADSLQSELRKPNNFLLVHRLFLLNLSSIYTTGFECPDQRRILPELITMIEEQLDILLLFAKEGVHYNEEYCSLFKDALRFLYSFKGDWEKLDHFTLIRQYIEPLYSMNQIIIRKSKVESIAYNEYALNNEANSLLDKTLYSAQEMKGVFQPITDSATTLKIQNLGRKLFYDPLLSGNIKRSCASCHKPEQYFTDTTEETSLQYDQKSYLPRNTPSLINVAQNQLMRMDGKHFNFFNQTKEVLNNPIELNDNESSVVKKILTCNQYKKELKYLVKSSTEKKINFAHISSALSFYLIQFQTGQSAFDSMMMQKKTSNDDITQGFNLFMGKAKCGTCHFFPGFGGVKPPFLSNEFEVLGVPEDTTFRSISRDSGRYNHFQSPEALFAFRTPTVRNIQYTKPYMHNGIFFSLNEVMDFYNQGGGKGRKLDVINQTLDEDKLNLSSSEIEKIISFMNSLSENIGYPKSKPALPSSKNRKFNARISGGEY
ncbi:MAG: cytochrome C peroxidase [Saprospiraceae bacterium]|nr:cytochrome C peroxidase [Saprospiraceae bacterium]